MSPFQLDLRGRKAVYETGLVVPDRGTRDFQEWSSRRIIAPNELDIGNVDAAEKWTQSSGTDLDIDTFKFGCEFFLDAPANLAGLEHFIVSVVAAISQQSQEAADANESGQALPCGHANRSGTPRILR